MYALLGKNVFFKSKDINRLRVFGTFSVSVTSEHVHLGKATSQPQPSAASPSAPSPSAPSLPFLPQASHGDELLVC